MKQPLPNVDVRIHAGQSSPFHVAQRVVEEHLVLADVHAHRRQPREVTEVVYWLLLRSAPLTEKYGDELIEQVLCGLRVGPRRKR